LLIFKVSYGPEIISGPTDDLKIVKKEIVKKHNKKKNRGDEKENLYSSGASGVSGYIRGIRII